MKRVTRTKVLFVCLGNACRSPMAEAIASRLAGDIIEATSAGLTPLGRVEPLTAETLARNGYPSAGLESKGISLAVIKEANIIVNMSGRPKEFALDNSSKVEDWRVEDPYGGDAENYQRIFEHIERLVAELARRLRNGAPTRTRSGNKVGTDGADSADS
jgi:arsenate reductase (thioredoxin)